MSPPWMPLYIADYKAATGHLSAEEHGAYLLLIMHYWTKGELPDDERQLARIACMTGEKWRKIRAVVGKFFEPGWRHLRVEAELAKVDQVSEKYAKRAKKAAEARWAKEPKPDATSTPQAVLENAYPPPHPQESPYGDSNFLPLEEPRQTQARSSVQLHALFDEWYRQYPRKVGKGDARKAYTAAIKKIPHDELMAATLRYAAARTAAVDADPSAAQFTPHPASWLNKERWADEPEPLPSRAVAVAGRTQGRQPSAGDVAEAYAEHLRRGGRPG